MKLLLVVVSLLLSAAAELPISVDYHGEIGIPEAARLKQVEEAQDFDGARIAGGLLSSLGQHPHLAGLLILLRSGQTSMCGASLLSNTKLVTAAHCQRTPSHEAREFTVVLGSVNIYTGGVRIRTNNIQLHANFNPANRNNDIAILTITPVTFTNHIKPISIASGNNQYVGILGIAAGFGATSNTNTNNQILRHASLRVITNAACRSVYGPNNVIDSTLCTSSTDGRSTCNGDFGGSLTFGVGNVQTLIGVSSFTSTSGCTAGQPVGFARVSSFANWIRARL